MTPNRPRRRSIARRTGGIGMRGHFTAALLWITVASPALAQQRSVAPPDLEKRIREFEAAFAAKDAKAIGMLFAPDGVFVSPGGVRGEGRDAITAEIRQAFDTILRGVGNRITIEHARLVTPDVAYVDMKQELTGGKPPPGAPRPWMAEIVLLARKAEGQWWFLDVRPYFFVRPRGSPPAAAGSRRAPPASETR
jgi:uncharacterized protein (TIGR02246 family)